MTVQFNHYDADIARQITEESKRTTRKMIGGLSKLLKTGYNTEIEDIDYMSLYPWKDLKRK